MVLAKEQTKRSMELSRAPTNTVNWALTKEQKNIMEQSQLLQQTVLEQLDTHMQKKINVDTDLTLLIKINWKWLTGLNIKLKTMELLEDRRKPRFVNYKTKAMIHERNNWQVDFIKIRSFCSAKDNVKRMRRQGQTKD